MNVSGKVIPHKVWHNAKTGQTLGKFSSIQGEGWELVERGFSIAWPDGSTGTGRLPFQTVAEANAYLEKAPRFFRGFAQH